MGLSLRDCGLASLDDAIGDLGSLVDLDLTGNRLTALPRSMQRLTSLECLWLDGNALDLQLLNPLSAAEF